MRFDVEELYREGFRYTLLRELNEEYAKRGCLRGGNSGLLDEGVFVGKCPRISYLRQQGMLVEITSQSRQLMFSAGHKSEDSWHEILTAANRVGLIVLREEQIPISFTTSNNTPVTGRPDCVLLHEQVPVQGLEHKMVCSVWTAISILAGQPKTDHAIQAGLYSWKMNFLNWDICYTNRVDWAAPTEDWAAGKLPKQDTPAGEHLQYQSIKRRKEGKGYKAGDTSVVAKKINPFRYSFFLRWNAQEELEYAPHADRSVPFVTSIITPARIQAYYDFVAEMHGDKKLGSRVVNMDCAGNEGGYNKCSYCEMQDVCDTAEKGGFSAFVTEAQKHHEKMLKVLKEKYGIIFVEGVGYVLT